MSDPAGSFMGGMVHQALASHPIRFMAAFGATLVALLIAWARR
jgi:hypothetical protein